MDIRIVSSLTSRDEVRVAAVILNQLKRLLDRLPIAYSVTISTSSERIFSHAHPGSELPVRVKSSPGASAPGQ